MLAQFCSGGKMQGVAAPLTMLLLLLVLPGQPQLVRNVQGSVDKDGTCHCVISLPSYQCPLQQLEQLQSAAQELISKYEQELSRVSRLAEDIKEQENRTLEMNQALESRKHSAFTSNKASTYNLLRLELEGAQESVAQLKEEGDVSKAGALLYRLQNQMANASLILKFLADYDQSSFQVFHQEVDILEGRLSQCEREKEQDASVHTGSSLPPGSCAHGGLQKVSSPLVVQLNWRGFSYKAGAWGRDSAPNSNSSLYWVAPLSADYRYFDYYRLYKSYNDLVLMKNYEEWKMGYGDGSGNTVCQNFMYFNYYGTNNMAKVDLSTNTLVLQHPLPGATFNNRFSYAGVPWKDMDFACDEKGLWVLYATEESKGNLVISRLNANSLQVEKTWRTSQYKPVVSGAFMACGVLYALRSLSTRQEEIFYAFDTSTGQEHHLSILLDKMLETLQGINYSPVDHKLYVFNDGYLVNYDLSFLTEKPSFPRPSPRRGGGSAVQAPLKPVKPSKT